MKVGVLGAAIALALSGTAVAVKVAAGNLVLNFVGAVTPTKLPRAHKAPIRLESGVSLRTRDGSHPPALSRLVFEYDKHGHVETRGLPTCTRRRLADTTVRQARRLCPGAIVGRGLGKGVVKFPDQAPIYASSPLTLFNGPRTRRGSTLFVHAYTTVPVTTTYLIAVRVLRIKKGRYGFRVEVKFPKLIGGYGSPTYGRLRIGRHWRFRGRRLSYLSARCVGGRLQSRARAEFRDGTDLAGSPLITCRVR